MSERRPENEMYFYNCSLNFDFKSKNISLESLVTGAIESAFWEMDQRIGEDKLRYKISGGCTALVALFILGKLYVANAGDSRAVLCRNHIPQPMSFDLTPETERSRLQQLGYQHPNLLGDIYTHLDFQEIPLMKDEGKLMLYRDAHMTGWAYKQIQIQDIKFPMVHGKGKHCRLLNKIGTSRGFGDHSLKAGYVDIYVKPFLSPQPKIKVFDIQDEHIGEYDVLVMATDGLWDVLSNATVSQIVNHNLESQFQEL